MIVRELITRFGFDVEERDITNFNKKLKGMKNNVKALAATLGIGLGAKGIFNLGKSTKQAKADLQRLAGLDFSKFQNQMGLIKNNLDGIRDGASGLVREKIFNTLAASFVQEFGSGEKQVNTFGQLFESAALQSAVSGKSIPDIFAGFMGTIKSGGFESLLGIPGFDVNKQKALEFKQGAIDPNEPGGRVGRLQREESVMQVLLESRSEMAKNLKNLDPTLLNTALIKRRTQDSSDKLSETATQASEPITNFINDLSNVATKELEKTSEKGFLGTIKDTLSGKGPLAEFVQDAARKQQGLTKEEFNNRSKDQKNNEKNNSKPTELDFPMVGPLKNLRSLTDPNNENKTIGNNTNNSSSTEQDFPVVGPLKNLRPITDPNNKNKPTQNIEIKNSITVNVADDKGLAARIAKENQRMLEDASRKIIKMEQD